MPRYSKKSAERLATCHSDLQMIFNRVIEEYDCSILYGHRSESEQIRLFKEGKSKVKIGKHNLDPSEAVDAAPYPINWGETGSESEKMLNLSRFYHFAGYVKSVADEMGIPIRWGGDWDGDGDFTDQKFHDLVHFELDY
jgi:peptidoglycan L-alanyl-D-glutamate endopeptidase CwlK